MATLDPITNMASSNSIDPSTGVVTSNPITQGTTQVPNTMPVSSITTSPIATPPVPTSHTDPLTGLVSQATVGLNNANNDVANIEGDKTKTQNDVNSLSALLLGQTADTTQASADAGIPQMSRDIRNLQIQQQGQQQKYISGLASIEGGNIRSLSNNQQVALQRQNAIDTAITGAQISAKQGNMIYAQELVKNAIEAKYQPIKDALTIKNQILEQTKDSLSRADKKASEAKILANNLVMKQVEQKMANDKTIQDMMMQASPVAPPDVQANAKAIADKGGSPMQVAMALGQYGGDYYKTMLLKKQIETEGLQQAKLSGEIKKQGVDYASSMIDSPIVQAWVARARQNPKLAIPKQYQDAVTLAMSNTRFGNDNPQVQAIQDKLLKLNDAISGVNNSGAVGPNALARTSLTSWATGSRQNFVATVKQLVSKETLDTLTNLKAQGGTLGALSDQERVMLQNAATKIGNWEIKDGVEGSGYYNANESDFKKELETIKNLTERALVKAGGTVSPSDNPFIKSMGGGQPPIQGTQIVNSVADDGTIQFNIPKK